MTRSPVTLIGTFWIAVGGLMAMAGAGAALVLSSIPGAAEGIASIEEGSGPFSILALFVRHLPLLVVIQAILGIIVIVAAIGFLRRHSVALSAIRIISWLALLGLLLFGALWIAAGVSVLMISPVDSSRASSGFLGGMMIFGALFTIAFYGTPIVLILRSLNRPALRAEFGVQPRA